MEEYKGQAKSYEDAKLKAILAVLNSTLGIFVDDQMGKITITKDGKKIATLEISI